MNFRDAFDELLHGVASASVKTLKNIAQNTPRMSSWILSMPPQMLRP
ncbi:MAG: hypothetical protein LBU32_07505 [Clostridiales bacterium]|nr:hypothetical protein [Clostridiales bacterium]